MVDTTDDGMMGKHRPATKDEYGLMEVDGRNLPTFHIFRSMEQAVAYIVYLGLASDPNEVAAQLHAHEFEDNEGNVWIPDTDGKPFTVDHTKDGT